MAQARSYNSRLAHALGTCLAGGDPRALLAWLDRLSVAEFRAAGSLLGDRLLPELPSDQFWAYFVEIVPADRKAYLGTFLKAAARMVAGGTLDLNDPRLAQFLRQATPIDCSKTLEALLPVIHDGMQAEKLLRAMGQGRDIDFAPLLLKVGTPESYYLLFNQLRRGEADKDRLRLYSIQLLKKGDQLSLNMAAIIRQYFDIADLPATLSLKLPPYAFSRLDASHEAFIHILKGIYTPI